MREYIVTYKQKYENFNRTAKYQADFINEALQRFIDDYIVVTESMSIKEYETPFFIKTRWEDDRNTYCHHYETFEELMYHASYIMAFDDCAPALEEFYVEAQGVEIKYDGWLSGMRYRWRATDTNEVVWDECYPSWDH